MSHDAEPSLPLRRVTHTIEQLLDEMRTVTEARCRKHGTGGGTTANWAAALLACIGIEMVATRTRTIETQDEGIRRVWKEVADSVGYEPYRTVGFALFKLCRNGIAHGFYPNEVQLANGPLGGMMVVFWIDGKTQRSVCVDEVGCQAESGHLTLRKTPGRVLLQVSVQHLYRDVKAYLERFLARLGGDSTLQATVEKNDDEMLRSVTKKTTEQLSEADFIHLGM